MASDTSVSVSKNELEKAIHILEGLIKGISIDGEVNVRELNELEAWCYMNYHLVDRQPYRELIPFIEEALRDEFLDEEEQKNILWYCRNFRSENEYYDSHTSDLQRLQGMMHGILSDGKITDRELKSLGLWLDQNRQLEHIYPYDELTALISDVLADGRIDEDEHRRLKVFFADHIIPARFGSIDGRELEGIKKSMSIRGLCEKAPDISFGGKRFCFTGRSSKATRLKMAEIARSLGAMIEKGVSDLTDFLIVGDNSSPYWAYSCYGRKVEMAIAIQKAGAGIKIALEKDFWSAVAGA